MSDKGLCVLPQVCAWACVSVSVCSYEMPMWMIVMLLFYLLATQVRNVVEGEIVFFLQNCTNNHTLDIFVAHICYITCDISPNKLRYIIKHIMLSH